MHAIQSNHIWVPVELFVEFVAQLHACHASQPRIKNNQCDNVNQASQTNQARSAHQINVYGSGLQLKLLLLLLFWPGELLFELVTELQACNSCLSPLTPRWCVSWISYAITSMPCKSITPTKPTNEIMSADHRSACQIPNQDLIYPTLQSEGLWDGPI